MPASDKSYKKSFISMFFILILFGAFSGLSLAFTLNYIDFNFYPVTVPEERTARVHDRLNLRSYPYISDNIIKTFNPGDTITVTGEPVNGWVPVRHGDDSGYVSARYITIK